EPMPMAARSGFALSQSINSFRFVAGTPLLGTVTRGLVGSSAAGSETLQKGEGRGEGAPLGTWGDHLAVLGQEPSGAAPATRPPPIVPSAPVTFSMMMLWPSVTDMRWAMTRAIVSVGPPAANGTFMVMGRVGYVCALATCAVAIVPRVAIASAAIIALFICRHRSIFGLRSGLSCPPARVSELQPAWRPLPLAGITDREHATPV